jgi:hypothetical protein
MKLPSRYLDTLGEEKGKSWEKMFVCVAGGGLGDESWVSVLLETLPFGCFLEATPPICCNACVLFSLVAYCSMYANPTMAIMMVSGFWLAFGYLSETSYRTRCMADMFARSPMMILVFRMPEGWVFALPSCALLATWCFLKKRATWLEVLQRLELIVCLRQIITEYSSIMH